MNVLRARFGFGEENGSFEGVGDLPSVPAETLLEAYVIRGGCELEDSLFIAADLVVRVRLEAFDLQFPDTSSQLLR